MKNTWTSGKFAFNEKKPQMEWGVIQTPFADGGQRITFLNKKTYSLFWVVHISKAEVVLFNKIQSFAHSVKDNLSFSVFLQVKYKYFRLVSLTQTCKFQRKKARGSSDKVQESNTEFLIFYDYTENVT